MNDHNGNPIEGQKPYVWSMGPDVAAQYNAIMAELAYCDPESEEAAERVERIRELPGYPVEFEALKDDGWYLKPIIVGTATVSRTSGNNPARPN